MERARAVFLDRDGVVNFDPGYLSNPNEIKILPKVIEGLSKIKRLGFLSIIISNQSGVARGYFDLRTMRAVDKSVKKIVNAKDLLISGSFYCPHHPDFDQDCNCRKPKTGLIDAAVAKYSIDTHLSFFIGDKENDILCGKNAGCKTILVPQNLEELANIKGEVKPDFVAKDLLDAASWIERRK